MLVNGASTMSYCLYFYFRSKFDRLVKKYQHVIRDRVNGYSQMRDVERKP